MKITSDLTNLTTAILILTVQMFIEWTLDKSEKFTIAKKMLYAPRPESAFTGLVSYQYFV
jgi:hypothetical protein